jgi:site-specific DNA recombinase
VADQHDLALKDRIAGPKATRDQAQADALRVQAMLESATHQAVTPQILRQFANTARKRMRADGGGYRRDHIRLLAQRVEVTDREIRIKGSKSNLLRTLSAISSSRVKSDILGVPSFVPKWWRACVTNPVIRAGAMVFTSLAPKSRDGRKPV